MTHQFDVIIVGAGIVGSALACALGGSRLRVAVVESQVFSGEWPEQAAAIDGYDLRVSALTLASQHFLQSLHIWPELIERRASAYTQMHVWDADGTGNITFNAADVNQSVLGHIVENRITSTALLKQMQQHGNVQLLAPLKLQSIEPVDDGHGYRLLLDDGRRLTTSLLVAADGANSNIRSLAGFETREWDYHHHAIVCTVKTQLPHQQTAWQRFLPEGPLAFLPLTTAAGDQQFCSIVWSALPGYADNLMQLSDEDFCLALAQAFEYRLGEVAAVSRRVEVPLRQRHAVDYIKPGLALVGDAAHTIHPLAGQGVNLGLMDVQVLSEELLRAHRREIDLGSMAVLSRYQRRRKAANLGMMAGMEGFKRLFAQPALPVRWARNAGMRWLDRTTTLKRRVMREAMGL
ncbi:MAG: FAD-dependent monooxygenase [Spongiibacteraceae bacterium]